MLSWPDRILRTFQTVTSPMILVSDPDRLFTEERLSTTLSEHGYEQIAYDDPIAFRFAYESRYRHRLGKAQKGSLVVLSRESEHNLRNLPYDLLQIGTRFSFSMAELLPKLSYPIIKELERTQFDKLYNAHRSYEGEELGDTATKEFLLKNIYDIAPEMIRTGVDLIKILILKHLKGMEFPKLVDDYLVGLLRRNPEFASWPLESIVYRRAEFFLFLQDSWEKYISALASKSGEVPRHSIPFDQSDIRIYMDNLFLEGWLKPIQFSEPELLPAWAKVGIQTDLKRERLGHANKLINRIQREIPTKDASYKDWQQLAVSWAELSVIRYEPGLSLTPNLHSRIEELQDIIEAEFEKWLLKKYVSLPTQSYWPKPVMLHDICPYLAHRRRTLGEDKIVLLVVDGLAVDQWLVMREAISQTSLDWHFEDTCIFAWVPTLTAISRQTIFAAQMPLCFGDSLVTTENEGRKWQRFWEDEGLQKQNIGYCRGLGSGAIDEIEPVINNPNTYILGLVVDTVDKIMHGMKLGNTGMHQQVKLWIQEGYLPELMERLWEAGFSIYLTSDHGNIEAQGQGRPSEGCLVETRGQRARLYKDESLLKRVQNEFPETIWWTRQGLQGLPEHYHVLLAKGRTAFTGENEKTISHGGIALEEVIVPVVCLGKEER